MSRQRLLLTLFVASPIVVIIGLTYFIVISLGQGPQDGVVRRGPGAGETGGANAIGEWLAHGRFEPPKPVATPSMESVEQGKVDVTALPQGFTLVVRDRTGLATAASPMYLAGTFNGWNPAAGDYRLTPGSDGAWRLTVNLSGLPSAAGHEFKLTRGSWRIEAQDAEGRNLANRRFPLLDPSLVRPGIPPEIEVEVVRWSDSPTSGASASAPATGVVRTLDVPGPSGTGLRTVRVWMPSEPGAGERWPVLYLLDGQNVFGDGEGSPRGWRADATAAGLIRDRAARPFVIVAVPHGGATRISEYLPTAALRDVTPGADETVQWITQVVAPAVEALGVTEPGPATIGGASLGAVAALEIAARAPERFNRVLMESPSLTTGDRTAWRRWIDALPTWPTQVWLGVGGAELSDPDRSAELVATVQALEQRLITRGTSRENVRVRIDADARHDEAAWGARFGEAARFLFPPL